MTWIARLTRGADEIEVQAHELIAALTEPPQTILDRALQQVGRGLQFATDRETVLTAEIAEREEQLRQTRVTKSAFELAMNELRSGVRE